MIAILEFVVNPTFKVYRASQVNAWASLSAIYLSGEKEPMGCVECLHKQLVRSFKNKGNKYIKLKPKHGKSI